MIPVRDENPSSTRPVVTPVLIALNVVVFLIEWLFVQMQGPRVIHAYGLVPARFLSDPVGEVWTVFSSMFMHGGWEHLGGNMLLPLHLRRQRRRCSGQETIHRILLSGRASWLPLPQMLVNPESTIPMVGASGAIAGILAAYLVLYPRAPIHVLNPILPLWFILGVFFVLPAWVVVGEWFLWNLLRGVGSLGAASMGGVAFFAHIGGFVAGLVAIKPMLHGKTPKRRAQWRQFRQAPRVRMPPNSTGPHRDPWFPG